MFKSSAKPHKEIIDSFEFVVAEYMEARPKNSHLQYKIQYKFGVCHSLSAECIRPIGLLPISNNKLLRDDGVRHLHDKVVNIVSATSGAGGRFAHLMLSDKSHQWHHSRLACTSGDSQMAQTT
jgi:hypothetical protein